MLSKLFTNFFALFRFRPSTLAFLFVLAAFAFFYWLINHFAIANGLNLVWLIMLGIFILAWFYKVLVKKRQYYQEIADNTRVSPQAIKKTSAGRAEVNRRARRSFAGELASYFPIFVILFFLRTWVYEPFKIPSGSMQPTLEIGDYIVVNKFHYRITDPIFQKTLWQRNPVLRGDVVVFKRPLPDGALANEDWVKRVMGLPGDVVHYDEVTRRWFLVSGCVTPKQVSRIYAFGRPLPTNPAEAKYYQGCVVQNVSYSPDYKQNLSYILHQQVLLQGEENLPRLDGSSITHKVLQYPSALKYSEAQGLFRQSEYAPYRVESIQTNTWVVPPGHFFVVGDNRDNSEDSRFVGFVPYRNIVGRADYVVLSFLDGQFPNFNADRFFLPIYPAHTVIPAPKKQGKDSKQAKQS